MSNNNWHPKKELCGYITEDGSLESLENLATKADREIWLNMEEVPETAIGLWHSHPNNDVNLSVEDYINFLQFPDYIHRIYSKDSYAEYYVRDNVVYRRE